MDQVKAATKCWKVNGTKADWRQTSFVLLCASLSETSSPVYTSLSLPCHCKDSAVTVSKHAIKSSCRSSTTRLFHRRLTGGWAAADGWKDKNPPLFQVCCHPGARAQCIKRMQQLDVVTWKRSTLFVLLHYVLLVSGTINTRERGEGMWEADGHGDKPKDFH